MLNVLNTSWIDVNIVYNSRACGCTLDIPSLMWGFFTASQRRSCILSQPTDKQAWVGAPRIARMTVGAGGRENSVAVHPPRLLLPHLGAGWGAAAAGDPAAGAVLAPKTKGGIQLQFTVCLKEEAGMDTVQDSGGEFMWDTWKLSSRRLLWCWCCW